MVADSAGRRGASVGAFRVEVVDGALRVVHEQAPHLSLWASHAMAPLVRAGHGDAFVTETRGFFQVRDSAAPLIDGDPPDSMRTTDEGVVVSGTIGESERWRLLFKAHDDVQLGFELSTSHPDWNRLVLTGAMAPDNRVFGFGEQFTQLDMKGRRVPVLSQEPGIGRGVQPLTWLMNTAFKAGGEWHNSNAPAPWYLTTDLCAACLENYEYSVFDFTRRDAVSITVFASSMVGRLFHGVTPLAVIEAYTRFAGRMRALPAWVDQGAIIGMQGGTAAVERMRCQLEAAGAPIAAF